MVIVSVLVCQICVLDIEKLVIAHSFSFGEMSPERPKERSKVTPELTSSGLQFEHFP